MQRAVFLKGRKSLDSGEQFVGSMPAEPQIARELDASHVLPSRLQVSRGDPIHCLVFQKHSHNLDLSLASEVRLGVGWGEGSLWTKA